MIGEKVSVWLNGQLVVDNVTMENYWDRNIPIFPKGAIELQAHGTDLAFRDIYVREISDKEFNLTLKKESEGFVSLFNGRNLDNWIGNKESYVVEDGMIVVKPEVVQAVICILKRNILILFSDLNFSLHLQQIMVLE